MSIASQQNRSESLNTGKESEQITNRRRYGKVWDFKITERFSHGLDGKKEKDWAGGH